MHLLLALAAHKLHFAAAERPKAAAAAAAAAAGEQQQQCVRSGTLRVRGEFVLLYLLNLIIKDL